MLEDRRLMMLRKLIKVSGLGASGSVPDDWNIRGLMNLMSCVFVGGQRQCAGTAGGCAGAEAHHFLQCAAPVEPNL